ncbi:MAG TPA: hypothetical protein VHW47_10240 [Acidimicrobiales bacterium]|nr:hypothetical protein [Acidimicrobiales bacterium]
MSDTATTIVITPPATAAPVATPIGTVPAESAPAVALPTAPAVAPVPAVATPATPGTPAATDVNAAMLAAIQSLTAEVAAMKASQPVAAPAVDIPVNPPSPVNLFEKGQLVSHTYLDPYDGPTTNYGIVVDILPTEGAGARSVIAWFGGISGPLGDQFLTAA